MSLKAKKKTVKSPVSNKVAKTPVVMQMEALECGAACLAMVLAYYDKWIPLEQVRYDCGVSRDGSNAKNILKAARNYGLEAAGYRLESVEVLRKEGAFPAIIHWNFNHFVVIRGFKGDKAYLNDPARGAVTVSIKELDESFTGICLMFEPSESFEMSGKRRSVLEFASRATRGTGVAVAFVILTSIITSLCEFINPVFSRIFLDRLLTKVNPEWNNLFILFFAIFSLIQIIVLWIQTIYSLKINGKLTIIGNASFMWKVLHLPMDFFSQRMTGDIQQRKNENATIASNLVETFTPLVLQTGMMFFYLFVMIRYSVILTALGLFSILIDVLMARIISSKRMNITRVQMRDSGKLSGLTVGGIDMIESIKAGGAENGFFSRWSGLQASVNTQMNKFLNLNTYLGMIPMITSELLHTAILITGIFLTMKGQFTLGMVTAFDGFLVQFTGPAGSLIGAGQTLQEMRTEMERIEDVMRYPDDKNVCDREKEDESYRKLDGEIELKNISFGYSRLSQPIIKNFNMKIRPGSRVAFVGSSGCGKSTLAKLITGLYDPWEGEILYDGKHLNEINRNVFTGSVAVVDQDIILFEDTIRNNIKMWDDSIEDFEMIMAARDAQIHDDIILRKGGYDHRLIEGGNNFSGGQRQRLEIARVLAQDPTVIILDEATSALDAKTEYDVVKAIKDRGITCIVIAHRLSTIRDSDEIVVLDHGEVVERGTHEELYEKGGYYSELVTSE